MWLDENIGGYVFSQNNQELFNRMAGGLPAVVWSMDLEGEITYVSPAIERLFGYSTDELNEKQDAIARLFFKIPRRELVEYLLSIEAQAVIEEHEAPTANGEFVWVETMMTVMRSSEGRLSGIAGITRDISERKAMELQLRQRTQELEALNLLASRLAAGYSRKEIIAMVLEAVSEVAKPDVALMFLREGDALMPAGVLPDSETLGKASMPIHRVGECLCGLAASEGQPIYSYDITTDPRCNWEECKQAGLRSFTAQPLMLEGNLVGVLGLASYSPRDFEAHKRFFTTLAGQVSVGYGNAREYKAVRNHANHLANVVETQEAELSDARVMAALGEVAGEVAHELRNPLGVIANTLYFLDNQEGLWLEKAREHLTIAREEVDRATRIIADLEARARAGRQ